MLTFEFIKQEQLDELLKMIKELAEYENLLSEVTATVEILNEWLFVRRTAEVLIIYEGNKVIGYTLFFYNFSTFLGKSGIYIEDLYIREPHRHKGYGTQVLKEVAQLCVQRGCGRLELSCLDWNEPSIQFYKSLGAIEMEGWNTYRFSGDDLLKLSKL